MTAIETINRIAVTSNDFAAAAGVGGVETAGAIISHLAAHPDQVDAFMAGGSRFLLDLDPRHIHANGLLTWHRKDGKVVTPEEVRALLSVREACQTKDGFEKLIRDQLRENIGDDVDTYTEMDYVLDLAEPGWPDSGIWNGIMVRLHGGGELTPREREQAIAYYKCEDGAEVPRDMQLDPAPIRIKLDQAPSPDTIIEYHDGQFGPLMFHYAAEGHRYDEIATEAGFDSLFLSMEDDLGDDEHPLMVEHFKDGQITALAKWEPTHPGGSEWKLVAKYDTEDGPMACFVRPHQKAEA